MGVVVASMIELFMHYIYVKKFVKLLYMFTIQVDLLFHS